jgi:hypothetical protein
MFFMTFCRGVATVRQRFRLLPSKLTSANSGSQAASAQALWLCLMLSIVRQAMTWRRGKGDPLKRAEIDAVNAALIELRIKIPELHDPKFLDSFGPAAAARQDPPLHKIPASQSTALMEKLMQLTAMAPQPRGFAFETFLADLFSAYNLAPRASFRLVGEQIDGSFLLNADTYLVEAKWHD